VFARPAAHCRQFFDVLFSAGMTFALMEPGGLRIGGYRVRCQAWLDMGEQNEGARVAWATGSK